jgi:FMN reductase
MAVNTMEFAVRALRGWAVPYVVPVASAARVFDEEGRVQDRQVEQQLKTLGGKAVRVDRLFAADGSRDRRAECDRAADRVASVPGPWLGHVPSVRVLPGLRFPQRQ